MEHTSDDARELTSEHGHELTSEHGSELMEDTGALEGPQPVDELKENRPGVPMEWPPRPDPGAHWDQPERQTSDVSILKHAGRTELTPVFGTAVPPRGLSGALRRAAYRIPEHRAGHWTALLLADRVDVLESRLHSRRTLAVVALSAAALALAWKLLRRRREVA